MHSRIMMLRREHQQNMLLDDNRITNVREEIPGNIIRNKSTITHDGSLNGNNTKTAVIFFWSICAVLPFFCQSFPFIPVNIQLHYQLKQQTNLFSKTNFGIRIRNQSIDADKLRARPLQSSSSNSNSLNEMPSLSSQIPTVTTTNSKSLIDAAADLTSSTSPLLGIKSIGVDYGLVRTGLAVTVGYAPKPLAILSDLNATELSYQIVNLAESEKADRIILGLPLHKNGTVAEQTNITRAFARVLGCAVYAHFGPDNVPVYLWDERYTSKEAAARARSVDPKAKLYKELDADAACIILEHYYNDGGKGAERVELPEDEGIRKIVEAAWVERRNEKEREWENVQEGRKIRLNARKMAMERAKVLDERLAKENGGDNSGKKKKKKIKKKRSIVGNDKTKSSGKKWITL